MLSAHDAFRAIIPYPEDRIPLTVYNQCVLNIAVLPMFYMAYLARRPDTYLFRLMLLPVAVLAIFGTHFRFKVPGVDSGPNNWGLGMLLTSSWALLTGTRIACAWQCCQGHRLWLET